MSAANGNERPERLAIVGSGTIACGLAACAARHGDVTLYARSDASAERAGRSVAKVCSKLEEQPPPDRVRITTDMADGLGEMTFVIEAIAEDFAAKSRLLAQLERQLAPDALLGTTTSSLPVASLAAASGRPDRFVGFHVFNPVARMELIELAFPPEADERTRERAHAFARLLDKRPVEVPDCAGFVVNRLLFPFLFDAVRFADEHGMAPQDVDACMTLGAGHPMGPLALLDYVGLDVSQAIGESLGVEVPEMLRALVAEGAIGKKAGRGFYRYDD
ncbi:MAG: 3-hydroxybutyryl-CoA dehydrogenase [Solirubrobacteraceae bacterium]|nr:3-hydroxybutyryl-CoA dehydrogenase [Solirubrobacteraceae bacterium]MEA2289618.1 3-hydroxybutyryl-CoA dehydrogenase [Solirubrobacteraceae bacterium]